MKVVDGDMTVLAPEQEPAERQSLPGRPQARMPEDRVGAFKLCRADLAFGRQAFSGFFRNKEHLDTVDVSGLWIRGWSYAASSTGVLRRTRMRTSTLTSS